MAPTQSSSNPQLNNESKPVQKYCLLDLKVAADEEVSKYFTKKGWKEEHTFGDLKLILGYFGAVIALADFLMTWKQEFKTVRNVSLISSGSYFVVSGFLYSWTNFVQGKTVYQGKNPNKQGLYSFKSEHKVDQGGQPLYNVSLVYEPPQTYEGTPPFRSVDSTFAFASFFDNQGKLSTQHLYSKLDSLISKLEPQDKSE